MISTGKLGLLGCAYLAAMFVSSSNADIVMVDPDDSGFCDLSHKYCYAWAFPISMQKDVSILGATLTIEAIHNWRAEENALFINLIPEADVGVSQTIDQSFPTYTIANEFAAEGELLVEYRNIGTVPTTLTYEANADQLSVMTAYAHEGLLAFGIDPDCHFYNDGFTLTLETDGPVSVPEPASLPLAATGFLCMFLLGMTRNRLRCAG